MSKKKGVSGKARNLLHDHPLLSKGGAHQKSQKAMRKHAKQVLRKGSWSDLNTFMQCI